MGERRTDKIKLTFVKKEKRIQYIQKGKLFFNIFIFLIFFS